MTTIKPEAGEGQDILADAITVSTRTSHHLPIDYSTHKAKHEKSKLFDAAKEDISLRRNLWTHFDPIPFLSDNLTGSEMERQGNLILYYVEDLPEDPYAQKNDGRYRAYARANLLLHGDKPTLSFVKGHRNDVGEEKLGYYQGRTKPKISSVLISCIMG